MRFNPPRSWFAGGNLNPQMFGMTHLIGTVGSYVQGIEKPKMLEIGSFMGESTLLFASMGCFDEIHCIEPFSGDFDEYKEYESRSIYLTEQKNDLLSSINTLEGAIKKIDQERKSIISEAADFAIESKEPDLSDLFEDIYI